MNDNLTITLTMGLCACVFGWCVWVLAVNIRRSHSSKRITELHSRLLDRFSGNQDLIAFLEGESGRRYFDALESDLKEPLSRLLNGIQFGIVLTLFGISLVAISGTQTDAIARNALMLGGVPAIAVGAGFLISSAITHYLTKSWGLLDRK